MINEKTFSNATSKQNLFGDIEVRRYTRLKNSPDDMFNPCSGEANPLEVGYERTKEILGL